MQITSTAHRAALVVALAFILYGCGSGGGDGAPSADDTGGGNTGELSAPIADLTGDWEITESGISNCVGQETYSHGPTAISITQSGNTLTIEAPAGTFSGTISGDSAGWTGSYPSGEGTTTITSMDLTVAADGRSFSGSAEWEWTDGESPCSGDSQSINATRAAAVDPVPQAPSGLSGSAESASAVTLVWNDNAENEIGFKLERRVSGDAGAGFAQIALLPQNATGHEDSGLNSLTAYDYRVRAYNASGDSAYSNVFTVTTLAPPAPAPQPPSDLVATAESTSSIRLQWNDNSTNETSFRIERSRNASSGFDEIASADADATSYTDSGLAGATQYFYRVRARNETGNSGYSNTANATTQTPAVAPAAPTNLNATPVSSSRIELLWLDQSDNETGFKIERSLSRDDGFTQIGTTAAGVTHFSDTGLERRTRYFYRVRATADGLDSDYSNVDDARTFRQDVLPDGDDDDDDDDDADDD